MIAIISGKEYEQFQVLKKVWKHIQFKRSRAYFICGEGGDLDGLGLPEYILVCPAHGADLRGTTMYKKVSKESE